MGKCNFNENIIKSYVDFQGSEKITFGNDNFNYFVYVRNSTINVMFDTLCDGVEGNVFVLLYGKGKSRGNFLVNIKNSNVKINVFIVSLLQDDNEIFVTGDVILSKDLYHSQGHLSEKNIILGKKIKIKAVPRLDVYSHDVHATHGVSIDKMSLESLFYMGTRGFSINQSVALLVSGIIDNILQNFQDINEQKKMEIKNEILSFVKISYD